MPRTDTNEEFNVFSLIKKIPHLNMPSLILGYTVPGFNPYRRNGINNDKHDATDGDENCPTSIYH